MLQVTFVSCGTLSNSRDPFLYFVFLTCNLYDQDLLLTSFTSLLLRLTSRTSHTDSTIFRFLFSLITDVWSAGCVLAELLLGQPIFPGDSGVDQLVEIIKVLGTPTKEQIREMNRNYTEFKFPQIKAHPWQKVSNHRIVTVR